MGNVLYVLVFFLREGEGACSVVRECTRFLSLTRTRYLIARDKGGGSMGKVFFFIEGNIFIFWRVKSATTLVFFSTTRIVATTQGKYLFLGFGRGCYSNCLYFG